MTASIASRHTPLAEIETGTNTCVEPQGHRLPAPNNSKTDCRGRKYDSAHAPSASSLDEASNPPVGLMERLESPFVQLHLPPALK
eukprot:6181025-Pleurochrysis_carterae.AAC.4